MLFAGMEMHPRDLVGASKRALATAAGGMIVPLMAGIGMGSIAFPKSDFRVAQMAILGTSLAITAVPVAVKVLIGLFRPRSSTTSSAWCCLRY